MGLTRNDEGRQHAAAGEGGPGRGRPGESAAGTEVETARELAGMFVAFLETGAYPEGLFTPDVFCDFTMPQWRLQARGRDDVVGLRRTGHPGPSRVPRERFDATATGFVLEVEERWEQGGESWYCRELFRADISHGAISQLSVYCTGDWDRALVARHAGTVPLIRPLPARSPTIPPWGHLPGKAAGTRPC